MKSCAVFLLLPLAACAADYHLELSPETTHINWTLGDVLHTVHGTFKLKRGDLHFDTANGKAGGELVVDAASGESGSGARDSRMQKNVLESSRYPDVVFAPDRVDGRIEIPGTSQVRLHGLFTIHGASHELTVPVQVSAKDNQLSAEIRFDVPYVAWGMKDPSTFLLKVSKAVMIDVQTTGRLSAGALSAVPK